MDDRQISRKLPERVPQWSPEETAGLLAIREELDASFMATKRNKPLWDAVSSRMHLQGFPRSPHQCKSKWKNLLTRFKGSEAMEGESSSRQFPFQEEMQRIVSNRMQRLVPTSEEEGKREIDDDDQDDVKEEEDKQKRRRVERRGEGQQEGGGVEGVLRELMRWQAEIDVRRMEEAEEREAERRAMEEECRRAMEAIAVERIEMERRWREAEDARRAREEARAERRHQLIAAVMAKLTSSKDHV